MGFQLQVRLPFFDQHLRIAYAFRMGFKLIQCVHWGSLCNVCWKAATAFAACLHTQGLVVAHTQHTFRAVGDIPSLDNITCFKAKVYDKCMMNCCCGLCVFLSHAYI